MSIHLINTAIFATLELSINSLLKLDPQALTKIQPLADSILRINVTSPELSFSVTLHQQGVHFSAHNDAPADVTISGTASALLALLVATKDSHSFFSKDLHLEGNQELLQKIQNTFASFSIDWEFLLSKFIGDIPTQAASNSIHAAKNFVKDSQHNLVMNLDEYIHQEKKMFPDKQELEHFYKAIDELRFTLDRASARLDKLNEQTPG